MTVASDTALTPAASGITNPRDKRAFRRILWLIGFGFFVQTITTGNGLASLPLRLLLKQHLHLLPTAVALFSAITGVAWYLKPLAGAFVDTVRIGGTRYRGYLLIGAAGAAAGWVLMAVVPQTYRALLLTFVVVNLMLMLVSTVLGGYMVTESRAFNATGRMASFRSLSMGLSGFVASPVAGYLASRAFGLTAGINAALLVLLFFYVFVTVRKAPAKQAAHGDEASFWAISEGKFSRC